MRHHDQRHDLRHDRPKRAALRPPHAAATALLLLLLAAGPTADAAGGEARLLPIQDADYLHDGRFPPAQVELGRLLFFDKILSGNRNISCATCHHPLHATSDGLSLPLGEGAEGLGPDRRIATPEEAVLDRVPRNSQALFNVGAREYTALFFDGRVEADPRHAFASGFWTPAREDLPSGLDSALAAQAMFPVTSAVEMAGAKGENPIATAAALDRLDGPDGAWNLLARRLRAIPEYVDLFRAAYPRQVDAATDITYVQAANALAAFQAVAFRSDASPFDDYLRTGDAARLGAAGERGRRLFYGRAGCSTCHSGKFQSDQRFHAIGMPQIGPGKHDGFDDDYWRETGSVARLEDYGRFRETGRPGDLYAFRTPALRNVELTGPWGHAGTFATLESVVRHHLDPVASLERYDASEAVLPPLTWVHEVAATGSRLIRPLLRPSRLAELALRDTHVQRSEELRGRIAAANRLAPVRLSDGEVDDVVAFLGTLTDPTVKTLDRLVPARVPSGLPVED